MSYWQNRAVENAGDLPEVPPALAPQDAQAWCNFIVWVPQALPADCAMPDGTLRMEAPPGRVAGVTAGRTPWTSNNPAAYRTEIAGPGRRLRIKQFLYDWAFPALEHPCLWESQTTAVPLNDTNVLWYGIDYMKNRAASARLGRTLIELSVLEGQFSDDEILRLYRSMRPSVDAAAAAIYATPFAELSYWARYPAEMVSVPIGLWKFRRTGTAHQGEWVSGPAACAGILSELGLPAELAGYAVDSAARFLSPDGRRESEVVYAAGADRGRELRLIAQRAGRGRLGLAPEPEPHPASHETTAIGEIAVALGNIDQRYGPWDAVWHAPASDLEVKLLSTTGIGMDRAWFVSVVAELISACRPSARQL